MKSLVEANIACLTQGAELLASITPDQYQHASSRCFNSTIGGHIRHNLDHYEQFCTGLASGHIDYDGRERDRMVETDPAVARQVSLQLIKALSSIMETSAGQDLTVKMDDGKGAEWSRSSPRRELQFLLSHSIHHYALIVAIGAECGLSDFPHGFGVAPSTRRHRTVSAG